MNQLVEQGKLKLTLVPQGTLAERIRAGVVLELAVFIRQLVLVRLWKRERKPV